MKLLFLFLIHPVRTWRFVQFCVSAVSSEMSRVAHDREQAVSWNQDNQE